MDRYVADSKIRSRASTAVVLWRIAVARGGCVNEKVGWVVVRIGTATCFSKVSTRIGMRRCGPSALVTGCSVSITHEVHDVIAVRV